MKVLYKKEILDLSSSDIKSIMGKKVKIYLTRTDLKLQSYSGNILEFSLTNNKPHKPFDILIELQNGEKITFGINGINKIEFTQ